MRSLLMGTTVGAALGMMVIGVTSMTWSANSQNDSKGTDVFQQLDLFAEVLGRVDAEYVVDVNESKAMTAAINGMLASLDPHSSYLPPEDFKSMQVQTSGEYGGLGIEVTSADGYVKVVTPIDDTPASRAGVRAGDLISTINGGKKRRKRISP